MRILLIEDEEDLAQPLVELLRREGFEAVWTANLQAAHDVLASTDFGLVVLDVLLLEDVDGSLELARAFSSALQCGERDVSRRGGDLLF